MKDKMFELTEDDFEDLYLENRLTRDLDEALTAAKSGKYRLPFFSPLLERLVQVKLLPFKLG